MSFLEDRYWIEHLTEVPFHELPGRALSQAEISQGDRRRRPFFIERPKLWLEYSEAKYKPALQFKWTSDGVQYLEINGRPSKINEALESNRRT